MVPKTESVGIPDVLGERNDRPMCRAATYPPADTPPRTATTQRSAAPEHDPRSRTTSQPVGVAPVDLCRPRPTAAFVALHGARLGRVQLVASSVQVICSAICSCSWKE